MNASASAVNLATAFARLLRGAGLAVPTSSLLGYADALAAVGLERRDGVYWSGRATLVHRPEDIEVYDRCFHRFWDREAMDLSALIPQEKTITVALDDGEDDAGGDDDDRGEPGDANLEVRFSRAEILRHKDFSDYTSDELAEFHRLMTLVRWSGARRRSRRLAATDSRTNRLDVRRTVRAALRSDGEAVRIHHRRHRTTPRRLVLLLDVSGSMEPYARALVRFTHAAVVGRAKVEVFALGTRLTRITRELASHDPDRAIRRAADAVVDWAGGTRLGDGLKVFNDEWGQRGMARGSVVVILSDGWDRGEPAVMSEQMARLSRLAERVVWVNPLKATTGYAPLARGMAAALPYIDHFVEGHSLDAVERLAEVLSR